MLNITDMKKDVESIITNTALTNEQAAMNRRECDLLSPLYAAGL